MEREREGTIIALGLTAIITVSAIVLSCSESNSIHNESQSANDSSSSRLEHLRNDFTDPFGIGNAQEAKVGSQFSELIDLMHSSALPQFVYAAERYSVLNYTDYLDINHGPLNVPEPVSIEFVGGGFKSVGDENKRESGYKIVISKDFFTRTDLNFASKSTYMLRGLMMFIEVSWLDGSNVQKVKIDRRDLEARAWINVFQIIEGTQVETEINDPYIIATLVTYKKLGPEKFREFFRQDPPEDFLAWNLH